MKKEAKCTICGEPMQDGEEMFKFHGYSGPFPKPPMPKEEKNHLLDAVKIAYRKHHMGDNSVGWDELSTILHKALCLELGDGGFCEWAETIEPLP